MIFTLFLLVFSQDKNFLRQNGYHISHVDIGQILPSPSFLVLYLSSNNVKHKSITNQKLSSQKGLLIGEVISRSIVWLFKSACIKYLFQIIDHLLWQG